MRNNTVLIVLVLGAMLLGAMVVSAADEGSLESNTLTTLKDKAASTKEDATKEKAKESDAQGSGGKAAAEADKEKKDDKKDDKKEKEESTEKDDSSSLPNLPPPYVPGGAYVPSSVHGVPLSHLPHGAHTYGSAHHRPHTKIPQNQPQAGWHGSQYGPYMPYFQSAQPNMQSPMFGFQFPASMGVDPSTSYNGHGDSQPPAPDKSAAINGDDPKNYPSPNAAGNANQGWAEAARRYASQQSGVIEKWLAANPKAPRSMRTYYENAKKYFDHMTSEKAGDWKKTKDAMQRWSQTSFYPRPYPSASLPAHLSPVAVSPGSGPVPMYWGGAYPAPGYMGCGAYGCPYSMHPNAMVNPRHPIHMTGAYHPIDEYIVGASGVDVVNDPIVTGDGPM
jgi:hypothetical protein